MQEFHRAGMPIHTRGFPEPFLITIWESTWNTWNSCRKRNCGYILSRRASHPLDTMTIITMNLLMIGMHSMKILSLLLLQNTTILMRLITEEMLWMLCQNQVFNKMDQHGNLSYRYG